MPPSNPPRSVPADIAALSFEDALKELEGIVEGLERGQIKLDDAIAKYTRGTQLREHCEKKLAEAKARIESIVVGPNGVSARPADDE
ncbi:MAG TPA: exodeoxyribonuclease VII small subunit [Alphaproteobacteria bacterium]|nr:exodeoxyribonuclease VII small subunit [Alphaproteobacteria bacterium]